MCQFTKISGLEHIVDIDKRSANLPVHIRFSGNIQVSIKHCTKLIDSFRSVHVHASYNYHQIVNEKFSSNQKINNEVAIDNL